MVSFIFSASGFLKGDGADIRDNYGASKVLAQSHRQAKMTTRNYAALTPQIWETINP